MTDSPLAIALIQQQGGVGDEGSHAIGNGRVVGEHLVGIERLTVEERVRDGVLLAAGVLDVLLQQALVEQVLHAQAAARHLVLVRGTNAARRSADLYATGRVLRRQLDQAVVGKNDVRAIADEEIAVHLDAGRAQGIDFLHEGERIEHDAITDDAAAAFAQHAARNELENKLLALDGNRMSGIVTAGITRNHLEALGQNVNDFAFAFVAPLRSDDDRCLACFQLPLHSRFAEIRERSRTIRTQLVWRLVKQSLNSGK